MYTRFNQVQFIKLAQDADTKKRIESYIKPKLEKTIKEDTIPNVSKRTFSRRIGISGKDFTVPGLLRSGFSDKLRNVLTDVPRKVIYNKEEPKPSGPTDYLGNMAQAGYKALPNNLIRLKAMAEGTTAGINTPGEIDRRANKLLSDNINKSITGYKRYLTPQNINRAAALGGIVSGGISGGNTLRSYGASTLGSLGGLTAGGLTSTGINRALDSYYGDSGAGGAIRRIALDTLIPSIGATTGGYFMGRSTR
jgi:hypothetical protein